MKVQKTAFLLARCVTCLTLEEEHKFSGFGNKVLRETFRPEKDEMGEQ
jgi:hypothetical protein